MLGALLSAPAVDLSGATESVTSALSSMGSSMTGIITTVLPVALTIVGTVMVVTFGVKIFRKLTGRA